MNILRKQWTGARKYAIVTGRLKALYAESGASKLEKIEVLGVEFHKVSLSEAMQTGSGWLALDEFRYVVTPNPEFILTAQKDMEFRQVLNQADLVLPDGIGVIYSSKILGRPLSGRVPGIDFAWGLLEEMNRTGQSLFLLGAKEGVAEQAGTLLLEKYPSY